MSLLDEIEDKLSKYKWATVIKDRYPQMKLHSNVGHAKAAVNYRRWWSRDEHGKYIPLARGGEIYYREAGGPWVLWFSVEEKGLIVKEWPVTLADA